MPLVMTYGAAIVAALCATNGYQDFQEGNMVGASVMTVCFFANIATMLIGHSLASRK